MKVLKAFADFVREFVGYRKIRGVCDLCDALVPDDGTECDDCMLWRLGAP